MAESLSTLYDPIHGKVDLSDLGGSAFEGAMRKVLSSPMLDRLKRIKQLGAASSSFIAADHSRFAHSLGTMQVARALFHALAARECIPATEYKDAFPRAFELSADDPGEVLGEHTVLAALLQDIGELPFGSATELIFRPAPAVVDFVSAKVGFNVSSWNAKSIFTVALLYEDAEAGHVSSSVHLPLLAFLIAGRKYPASSESERLQSWLCLLDGELDADRLDYVYRDAHHTIGARGTPQAVIAALARYDDHGPVVSDAGPVVDFLATRALLWQRVYLSASNRFRRLLLALFLREALSEARPESREILMPRVLGRHLSTQAFRTLDDVLLEARLRQLREDPTVFGLFSRRAQRALDFLVSSGEEYGHFWLVPGEGGFGEVQQEGAAGLPAEMFYDTYREFSDHWLYQPGSIRVEAESLRHVGVPAPIETFGFFGGALGGVWPAAPIAKAVQVFIPRRRDGADWEKFDRYLEEGSLYERLVTADQLLEFELSTDTRELSEFKGRAIFVSFRWEDQDIVDEVLRELWRRKRRYQALRHPWQGLGRTTAENSRRGVAEAEGVLVVASVGYAQRWELPSSNIAIEVQEMIRRRGEIPIVFLTLDDHRLLEEKLPWDGLGFAGGRPPFLGRPLKGQSRNVIAEAVEKALEVIDGWRPQ